MDMLVSVCLGVALAAACGFRVFVPLLLTGAAGRLGVLELADGFAWLASHGALLAFAVATALEVAAYYVPWLDNLLDAAASPSAVLAGVLVAASVITGTDPLLRWTLAVVAGGGAAGAVQATTVVARQLSALGTGGLANPVLATLEGGGATALALLAIALPVVAALVLLSLLFVAWRLLRRRRRVPAS